MTIRDGRIDAKAVGDVRLREGACDPVGIWVTTQRDKHVFPFGRGQGVGEGLGPVKNTCGSRDESSNSFRHNASVDLFGSRRRERCVDSSVREPLRTLFRSGRICLHPCTGLRAENAFDIAMDRTTPMNSADQ